MNSCITASLALVLSLLVGPQLNTLHAQQVAEVASEHRYLFSCQGVDSDLREKQLAEALRSLDPEMVISIDRGAQLMKLVAQRSIPITEVTAISAQYGVTATPRRRGEDREGNYTNMD